MIKASYEQLIERISRGSGMSREEIERRVEAKRAKLSGLVSKEGAAQIIAAELGISFDKQKVKISELISGMRKISVVGKVIQVFPVRSFKKGGNEGKVANLLVADETSSTRVVLWDTNHISLVESGAIKEGSVVNIKDAGVREGEIHLSSLSDISISNEKMDVVQERENLQEKEIARLNENDRASVRAFIVRAFEPRFFSVCPECSGKVIQDNDKYICSIHGSIIPKSRIIFTMIIDDGTENIRAICFSDNITKLFEIGENEIENFKNSEFFIKKREGILGKEFWFSGRARKNKLFGNPEFIISDLSETNPEEILKKLGA